MNGHLTPRQAEFVRLRALGLSRKDIANREHLAESTVGNTLLAAYRKLGAQNLAQALAALGWLKVPD